MKTQSQPDVTDGHQSRMVHYAIEYGSDGLPIRMLWSKKIQAAGEANVRKLHAENAELDRQARKPMQCCQEWARRHGLF